MRLIVRKSQFKRDYKRLLSSGKKLERLFEIIELLQKGETLPQNNRDHALTGNWKGCRECHIGGDWLLIYQVTERELILLRSGNHSELFK